MYLENMQQLLRCGERSTNIHCVGSIGHMKTGWKGVSEMGGATRKLYSTLRNPGGHGRVAGDEARSRR